MLKCRCNLLNKSIHTKLSNPNELQIQTLKYTYTVLKMPIKKYVRMVKNEVLGY